ncbi:MAG: hypothetical protein M3R07_09085 [Gemmatimonadota bacterium]|nr:hypothetical protein [Gemmatimonadota bacterium]
MIEAGEWIRSREPAPPAVLADRLAAIVSGQICADTAALAGLLAGEAARLLENLHDDRKGAEDLLVADALVTYAMEAAAEDPGEVERITVRTIETLSMVSSRGGKG